MSRGTATITHPVGLHARPAIAFTRLAKGFADQIRIRQAPDGAWVDAKSMVKVMGLKLRRGADVEIEADGDTADAALAALLGLIGRDFDEPAA